MIQIPGRRSPSLRALHPASDERALYVAQKKAESKGFKTLQLGMAGAP